MIRWLRDRANTQRIGRAIYDSIVAQSRSETLYRCLGVPDTMDGRFELIVLHMHLVLERLRSEDGAGIGRAVIEAFVTDMDDAMREMGIGDLAVPRRVKRAAAAVYERSRAYAEASHAAAAPDRLPRALAEHVYRDNIADARMPARLADYVRQVAAALETQPWSSIRAGNVWFPAFEPGRRQDYGREKRHERWQH